MRLIRTFFITFSSVAFAVIAGAVLVGGTAFIVKKGIQYADTVARQDTSYTTQVAAPGTLSESAAKTKASITAASLQKVTAESYIVVNLTSGQTVVEKDADRAVPIASITKLFTAVVAKESLDPRQLVTINSEILATEGVSGGLKLNEKIRVENLFYPLLMVSSNDAAEALAMAAGRQTFIAAMNNLTTRLGAISTYFADPTGLSALNISTARELARLLGWMYISQPDLMNIALIKTKSIPGHSWTNGSPFLNLSSYKGGKNGFTDEANKTEAAVFMLPDASGELQPHVIVVLRSHDRVKDVMNLIGYVEKNHNKQ